MLDMLKIDLGITGEAYDARLEQYIRAAQLRIQEEGVDLDASAFDDRQLVVTYAAWMWRSRDSMTGMPRMLRYALNNRLFAQKMKGAAE